MLNPAKLEEVTFVFIRDIFRSTDSNFAIRLARFANPADAVAAVERGIKNEFSVIGESEPDDIKQYCEYRAYADANKKGFGWINDEKYGWQFRFHSFVRSQPFGRAGVIRYLQEAPGIGHGIA